MESVAEQKNTTAVDIKKPRYHILDTLRGIMIIGVVLSHFAFDLYSNGFHFVDFIVESDFVEFIEIIGRVLFILLAGMCSRLTRHRLKRSLITCGAALAITAATGAFIKIFPDIFIYFGILHLMGVCMLIDCGVSFLLDKITLKRNLQLILCGVGAVVFFCVFLLTYDINSINTPLHGSLFGYLLGFSGFTPVSADYFPLLPWAFVFFSGSFLGVFIRDCKMPSFFSKDLCPPITFIGRHTLIIYLLHQPILFGFTQLLVLALN